MDERGAFVHRNENHVHVVMGGIYVNTVLLSLIRSPSLFIALCHTHTYTNSSHNNPRQFDLVDTKKQWWVTFGHKTCKYRWINTHCANIYCLKYTLSVLFVYLSLIWWGWNQVNCDFSLSWWVWLKTRSGIFSPEKSVVLILPPSACEMDWNGGHGNCLNTSINIKTFI